MTHRILIIALLTTGLLACESKPADKPDTEATPTEPAAEEPSKEEAAEDKEEGAAKKPEAAEEGEAEAGEEEPPAMEMEEDPNARGEVERVDYKNKAPEGFEVKGDVVASFGWRDKYGANAVVFAMTARPSKAGETALLVITHALQEGDGSWKTVRDFKERVADCQFDVTLEPKTGEWSVSDIDGDGLGEATIAYSAGCRSDVSPVTHKILMTEDGEKYALRGQTKVDSGGGVVMGGEFKVDPSFKKAPKGFQAHAEKAWAATVTEKM